MCRFAFPAYDALAASILRHIVEDSATLQAAMESEIHATMNAPGRALTKCISQLKFSSTSASFQHL